MKQDEVLDLIQLSNTPVQLLYAFASDVTIMLLRYPRVQLDSMSHTCAIVHVSNHNGRYTRCCIKFRNKRPVFIKLC